MNEAHARQYCHVTGPLDGSLVRSTSTAWACKATTFQSAAKTEHDSKHKALKYNEQLARKEDNQEEITFGLEYTENKITK
jgi:hypothetical protein